MEENDVYQEPEFLGDTELIEILVLEKAIELLKLQVHAAGATTEEVKEKLIKAQRKRKILLKRYIEEL